MEGGTHSTLDARRYAPACAPSHGFGNTYRQLIRGNAILRLVFVPFHGQSFFRGQLESAVGGVGNVYLEANLAREVDLNDLLHVWVVAVVSVLSGFRPVDHPPPAL